MVIYRCSHLGVWLSMVVVIYRCGYLYVWLGVVPGCNLIGCSAQSVGAGGKKTAPLIGMGLLQIGSYSAAPAC